MVRLDLIEEAAWIGERILQRATWDGGSCSWEIPTPDLEAGRGAVKLSRTSDCLYNGSAGIALFLAELWRCSGDRRMLACAHGAMRNCERFDAPSPSRVGLYVGNIGVAIAAVRLAEVTGDDAWYDVVRRRLGVLDVELRGDVGLDVINGAAGAILGLVRIARAVPYPAALASALRLGEYLETTAARTPDGWSWPSRFGHARRNLCGYSHGASGMAHAFLELFAATGDPRWRFAASRTMAYERSLEQGKSGDWPDFRTSEMSVALMSGGTSELRLQAQAGRSIPPSRAGTSRWWCHGAPGIALTRARAVSLGVDVEHSREELDRALRATRDSLANPRLNHSLCHGAVGNVESLLIARERLGIDDGGAVNATIDGMRERAGKKQDRQWTPGSPGGGYDPSLLLGEAGVGHFFLRVACPDVPSALCISDWASPPDGEACDIGPWRMVEIEHLMPVAARLINHLPAAESVRSSLAGLVAGPREIDGVVRLLCAEPAADASTGDPLREALALDAACLEETSAFTDFVDQFAYELAQPALHETPWDVARIGLAPHTRMIRTEWAWSSWDSGTGELPPRAEDVVVLYRSGQNVQRRWLDPIESLILESITTPRTLAEIVEAVLDSVDAEADVVEELPAAITAIVHDAVESRIARVFADAQQA